jgi:hypothetical protein
MGYHTPMDIPPEQIEEIKRQARREVASKAGKMGFKRKIEKIMQEQGFETEEEAKHWYCSTNGAKKRKLKRITSMT